METLPPNETAPAATSSGWSENRRGAFLVRTLVIVAPFAMALLATWAATRIWEAPDSGFDAALRFVVLAAFAMAVAAGTDSLARRLLPLAALLRLSLVFPDEAPSRFVIALRSGSTRSLEKRLAELDTEDFAGTDADAARIIVELAAALSRHDRLTKGHSERVRAYTALIAEEMGLSPDDVNKLQWAGLIHDVGKLKIPYEILSKPGALTDREYAIIKTHPTVGMQLAAPLADFLGPWIRAVEDHHERFDGKGYPHGLRGEDISLGGRIVAVADVYDVLTAARSYKKPQSAASARRELARCAGTQFDPQVVRAFLNVGLGTVRRSMWPLSWVVPVPFIGAAVTAPVTQAVTASVLTLATATGVTAATGGLEPIDVPAAIAFIQERNDDAEVADQAVGNAVATTITTTSAPDGATSTSAVVTPTSIARTTSTTSTLATTTTRPSDETTVAPTTRPPETTAAPVTTTTTTVQRVSTTTEATVPTAPPDTTTSTTTTIPDVVTDDCVRAQEGDSSLAGADLSDCDLDGVDLSGAVLDGANFAGAQLYDVDFLGASLIGANFNESFLTGVNFDGADLRNAQFRSATIDSSSFVSALLSDADFTAATLNNGSMFDATLVEADFTGAVLNAWSLKETTVVGAVFDQAVFIDSLLKYAQADGASFVGADITDLWIYGSSFVEADFTNALGTPQGHEDAVYDGTVCVGGEPSSTSCWEPR